MPGKWIIEKAVWLSDMPAPRKTIMAALLFKANSKTGQIPDEYTPSLSELVDLTSLGRSTVARELNTLEGDGWLRRHRPGVKAAREEKKRTRYFLTIPKGWKTTRFDRSPGPEGASEPSPDDDKEHEASPTQGPELVPHRDQRLVPHRDWLVPQRDQASPTQGPELVPQRDKASPTAGPNNTNTPNTSSSSARDDLKRSPEGGHEEEEEEIDEKRSEAPANATVVAIAEACGIDHEHAGRAYFRVLARGNVGSPSRFCAELIRNGDIEQYLDRPTSVVKPRSPKCTFEPNPREPGWCKACRMPEANQCHSVAA